MTQYDIIRMAQAAELVRFEGGELEAYRIGKASIDDHSFTYWSVATEKKLERFAKLIEQHLYYDGIHTCHDECQRPSCVRMREAVQAEREACAKLCEQMQDWPEDATPYDCAKAIRARGEK